HSLAAVELHVGNAELVEFLPDDSLPVVQLVHRHAVLGVSQTIDQCDLGRRELVDQDWLGGHGYSCRSRRRTPGPLPFWSIKMTPAASRAWRMAARLLAMGVRLPDSKSLTVETETDANL